MLLSTNTNHHHPRALLLCLVATLTWLLCASTTNAFVPHCTTTIRREESRRITNKSLRRLLLSRSSPRCSSRGGRNNNREDVLTCFMAGAKKGAAPPAKLGAEFEYEELKAQLQAMRKQDILSVDLTQEKRLELQNYVAGILQKRPSPIPLTNMAQSLVGTSWKLCYSTPGFDSSGLPRGARIAIGFVDDRVATYCLEFGPKIFGIQNIKATCTWKCGSNPTARDPTRAGVVTFQYNQITTDVFGFRNINVGLFGMLQGRSTYVQSVYYDGDMWIEEGSSGPSSSSSSSGKKQQYYNVYLLANE